MDKLISTTERCRSVAEVARDAIDWMSDGANAETVGQEKAGLVRELRRLGARAGKLAAAAERPMCVGVFGPSQAGKSFLVSVLARPVDGQLVALFEGRDEGVDFIREINPEGEGESTGLVTRFTTRPYQHPPGFPVRLRVLSEADVLCTIANSFMMDGDLSEAVPQADEIAQLLDRFSGRAGAAPGGGLSTEQVWEAQEYFEKQFGRNAYTAGLKTFWEDAAELAPKLSLNDRAEFLAILWGRHEPFTSLYKTLVSALEKLGFPSEAYCPIDALLPREISIIDVKTLAGLDGADTGTLAVKSSGGSQVELPRSLVTALTAELHIVMREQPQDFFEHTDLLDFPGARSRFERELGTFFKEAEAPLKESFLRGKVAYLFDCYVAEQELTSMLLCIPPSNMEVADLPGLVSDWIAHTHGVTPEERGESPCVLFFVLTKFDIHLVDSAGSGDEPGNRFKRRMQASLQDPFGGLKESWPNNWVGGQPFRNCFWLRNPNYPAEAVIRYDEGAREVELLPQKTTRLAELKQGCLSVAEVQQHFRNPERAWNAAMELNDGGVAYLVENLTPVCRPEMKDRQIAAQLAGLRATLLQRLARFYVSSDLEQRLAERRGVADQVVEALYNAADRGRFGRLLDALMVDPSELTDRLFRIPKDVRIVAAHREAAPAAGSAQPRPVPGRPRPGGAPPAADNGAAAAKAGGEGNGAASDEAKTMTRAEYQASESVSFWLEEMHEAAGSSATPLYLGIDPQWFAEITTELAVGARRQALTYRLTQEIERFSYLDKSEAQAAKPALIASWLINRYVGQLGMDDLPEGERPVVEFGEEKRPVFTRQTEHHDCSELGSEPEAFAESYLTDWAFALYRLFVDNAKSEEGTVVDMEQNARIGALLSRLNAEDARE